MLDGTEYFQWMHENVQHVRCSEVHTASVSAWLRWLGIEVAVDVCSASAQEIVTWPWK